MKDAVLTIRLPAATRRQLELIARREHRSLSSQVERLLEQAMGTAERPRGSGRTRGSRSLSGALRGGRVPTLADFRAVRTLVSDSLLRRSRDAEPRR